MQILSQLLTQYILVYSVDHVLVNRGRMSILGDEPR